jgi:hypothetical protein
VTERLVKNGVFGNSLRLGIVAIAVSSEIFSSLLAAEMEQIPPGSLIGDIAPIWSTQLFALEYQNYDFVPGDKVLFFDDSCHSGW